MENYEQKYKEALGRAKSIYNAVKITGLKVRTCEQIFPELKESEDEKIRKGLIKGLSAMRDIYKHQTFSDDAINIDDTIAWLEKQEEQKPANTVEPKFKVGDWITNGEYTWKVTDIKPLDYILQSPNGDVVDDAIYYVDEHFHLWTIQDAKDGDVLVYEGEIFMIKSYVLWHKIVYHCCYDGKNLHKHSIYDSWRKEDFDKVHPATKEQREFLFRKMKETGYEWDAERKELKKIEQNPAWSEEDEKMINDIDDCIKNLPIFYETIQVNGEKRTTQQFVDSVRNWLKSINSNHWKPSEQNIKDLEWCADLIKDKMGVGFHRLQVFIDEIKNL